MPNKVSIGMSGGVDSSVAAYILKEQGYDVTGVTMRLCDKYVKDFDSSNIEAAKSVCEKLGISFKPLDCQEAFDKHVIENFIKTYEQGMTPNPCVECNKHIKFDLLSDGDSMIATGHYAIVEFSDDRYKLKKSTNLQKDQSYFLYALSQETLGKVIFPLGEMDKDEVRKIAEKQGFSNANKKDSQDICFIPGGDYASFILEHSNTKYPEGNFVDANENILGRHKGIIHYTIGQRKGLGLSLKKPMYVSKLDMERNEIVLVDDNDLFSKELTAANFNWLSIENPGKPFRALGRIRYRHKESPCTVTPNQDGTVSVLFDEPQRAITSGQSLVLYDEKTATYVLGGGVIL